MRKSSLLVLGFSAATVALLACEAAAADKKVGITGVVLDDVNHPVKHALVVILDRDTKVSKSDRTDGKGRYEIWHLPASHCSVRVFPPDKSGLAQAYLSDVISSENGHVLIKVHKGFSIYGRILDAGKPARSLRVQVTAADGDDKHDGGETYTDGKGQFSLVLTPGNKNFEFSDQHHRGGPLFYHRKYSVTTDGTIPDIDIANDVVTGASQ